MSQPPDTEADAVAKTPGLVDQIHFDGTSDCERFAPHRLKPNICTECYKLIEKHKAEAVLCLDDPDSVIRAAIEFGQKGEKQASEILPPADVAGSDSTQGEGGLYLGGFKSVLNRDFVSEKKVKFIVNTAKGLEMFGPAYLKGVEALKSDGVSFLELNWVDSDEQARAEDFEEDLRRAVKFVHGGRVGAGGNGSSAVKAAIGDDAAPSVLVHCAQGKSRSTMVVVAYLMSTSVSLSSVDEALSFVQARRAMAQPNPGFVKRLEELAAQGFFERLREELRSSSGVGQVSVT